MQGLQTLHRRHQSDICLHAGLQEDFYEKSNLLRFTARDRFGSIEYRLDLRGITTMMNTSEQNRLIHEITLADRPEDLLQQWLEYVEWIHEHEREDMPGGILRRITTLRHRLIWQKERIEQDAGR